MGTTVQTKQRTFEIHEIRGKGRPRFNRHGRPRTPDETRRYEEKVRHCYHQAYRGYPPFKGAIELQLEVFRKRNKNDYSKRGGVRTNKLRRGAPRYATTTPDLSNIVKVVEDALNKVAYNDDRQIVSLHVTSGYNRVDRAERIVVTITQLEAKGGNNA